MSRIGNMPIEIASGVEVKVVGDKVVVKGPKGTLEAPVSDKLNVKVEGGKVLAVIEK